MVQMEGMTSLKWYRKIKEDFREEGWVRLKFRLRSGSAGLMEDKRRCHIMGSDDRCVL